MVDAPQPTTNEDDVRLVFALELVLATEHLTTRATTVTGGTRTRSHSITQSRSIKSEPVLCKNNSANIRQRLCRVLKREIHYLGQTEDNGTQYKGTANSELPRPS